MKRLASTSALLAFVLATLTLPTVLPAHATGEIETLITAADKARLAGFEATRTAALERARSGGDPADVKTLDALVDAEPASKQGFDMTGDWRCRTVLAGSAAPLVVYDWFRCKVTDDGSGWRLTKLTGSQRTDGRFFDEGETRMIYLGGYHAAGDAPTRYGADPATDQVGYAYVLGPDHWRLEIPFRGAEGVVDFLEFRR